MITSVTFYQQHSARRTTVDGTASSNVMTLPCHRHRCTQHLLLNHCTHLLHINSSRTSTCSVQPTKPIGRALPLARRQQFQPPSLQIMAAIAVIDYLAAPSLWCISHHQGAMLPN
mmetsp:Transcript_24311/g.52414  ORF Transcript_24311/g.52414 Transcript_24311/m.52414 type:complete len:115 (+) Transcript_24311:248-592(+)